MTSKTYFLGRTANGSIVARASGHDYGYTHAAVRQPAKSNGAHAGHDLIHLHSMTFSTSLDGANRNASANRFPSFEVVALEKVDRATFKAATGKA